MKLKTVSKGLVLSMMIGAVSLSNPQVVNAAESAFKSITTYNSDPTGDWVEPERSFYKDNLDGTFTRAEFDEIKDALRVEVYNKSNYKLLKAHTLSIKEPWAGFQDGKIKTPIFGGVFMGENYNFVFVGQKNYKEDDDKEVIRIVKYDKDWTALSTCSLRGCNTAEPFYCGNLRCIEYGDMLYVHTCHAMYDDNHQANMRFAINQKTDDVVEIFDDTLDNEEGAASHSLNQYIVRDGEDIYTLDHGDFNPPGMFACKYSIKPDGTLDVPDNTALLMEFKQEWPEGTETQIGGFAISESSCLVTFNADDKYYRSAYFLVAPKTLAHGERVKTIRLDKVTGKKYYSAPKIVKLSGDRFLILWQQAKKQKSFYVIVDGQGNMLKEKTEIAAFVTDCQPQAVDDVVSWYSTGTEMGNTTKPTVYSIDANTGKFTSIDVDDGRCAPPYITFIDNKKNLIIGDTTPRATVHIKIGGKTFTGKSNSKGKYKVKISAECLKKQYNGFSLWATKSGLEASEKIKY